MLEQYGTVLVFLVLGLVFVWITLVLSHVLAPFHPTPIKQTTYECGEFPTGDAWIQYNVRFYIIALLFLLFDVEVALMYPTVVVFKSFVQDGQGLLVLIEILVFVLILFLGLFYAWLKGGLKWFKKLELLGTLPNKRIN